MNLSASVNMGLKKILAEDNMVQHTYFSTGCKLLDLVVGGSKGIFGFPAGKFINIVGDKSSGKTFLSNEIIASAYHSIEKGKFKWMYDDCESGYSFDSESMYGFDIKPETSVHSTTVEEAFCNIADFADSLKKGQCGIYVLDSLDSLTSSEQDERAEDRLKAFHNDKSFDKGTYGMGKQKYLSQEFFPQLCSKIQDKNILVIIISQIRENVDMFSFEKFSRSGGKAMDFYAHTVLWLATVKKIMKKGVSVGVVVKAKVTKSKTARPFRECFFNFIYDYGLDDIGSSIDYLFDLRTEKGELNASAKSVRWENSEKIGVNPIKAWLKDEELLDSFKESSSFDGKVTVESVLEWVGKDSELKKKFNARFGSSCTRDELITWIEDNSREEELRDRVVAKWEDFESEISSKRKRKYGVQPIPEAK